MCIELTHLLLSTAPPDRGPGDEGKKEREAPGSVTLTRGDLSDLGKKEREVSGAATLTGGHEVEAVRADGGSSAATRSERTELRRHAERAGGRCAETKGKRRVSVLSFAQPERKRRGGSTWWVLVAGEETGESLSTWLRAAAAARGRRRRPTSRRRARGGRE
jgi:hypothetical protein